MITYFTQDRTFTLERNRFAPRSQSWVATVGTTLAMDGGEVFATGATQDELMARIALTIDLQKRIEDRLARKGL